MITLLRVALLVVYIAIFLGISSLPITFEPKPDGTLEQSLDLGTKHALGNCPNALINLLTISEE